LLLQVAEVALRLQVQTTQQVQAVAQEVLGAHLTQLEAAEFWKTF
jgi:hypothetical protein